MAENKKVKIAFTDIDGIVRGKYIHQSKFDKQAEKGIGFCDVVFGWDSSDKVYENEVEKTGWHTGFPDANLSIDKTTKREIPWEEEQVFYLGDFSTDKFFKEICPRSLLKRVEAEATKLGFTTRFSQEFEWFNFKELSDQHTSMPPETITKGMFGYSLVRLSQNNDFIHSLIDGLEDFGVPVEGLHTETGPGVLEGCIIPDSVVKAADKASLFKLGVKEIAHRYDITASFMAKWNEKLPGCSGHIHQSLWDKNGKNVFHSKEANLSENLQHYIAGQLQCLPYIMPMFAPTVNSYKRLVEGSWAPTQVAWGFDNRTCALRVIRGEEEQSRLETRIAGADCNPYLAIAASLAAGLYGIKNKLELKRQPVKGNAYANQKLDKLPSNLKEATEAMRNSKVAVELFGEAFVNHFCTTRENEWAEYNRSVSDWELKRYLEII